MEADERLEHGGAAALVEREHLPVPVDRHAHALLLVQDAAAKVRHVLVHLQTRI